MDQRNTLEEVYGVLNLFCHFIAESLLLLLLFILLFYFIAFYSFQVREIAAKYPEYNVTAFNEYSIFAEQYLIILPSTLRNVLIAIPCMLIVSLVMIPSITCALLIVAAIISIDIGEWISLGI